MGEKLSKGKEAKLQESFDEITLELNSDKKTITVTKLGEDKIQSDVDSQKSVSFIKHGLTDMTKQPIEINKLIMEGKEVDNSKSAHS